MNKWTLLCISLFVAMSCREKQAQYGGYHEYPAYQGKDLGLTYTPAASTFRLWSPVAKNVVVHLYRSGTGDNRIETVNMDSQENGLWQARVAKDLNGLFYTFQVETDSLTLDETPGIYAKATGVNGRRAAIIDWNVTHPEGWADDRRPNTVSFHEAVLYEMHIRDYTIHPSAGSRYPGKYLGLTERLTRNPAGEATGLDHLREMGITHVHLLPAFDFRTVNETKLDSPQFNWGYDPQNYNVPEGSYATDPYNPVIRILEFKQMVQALHASGIRVVMDVVYNHTGETEKSNFNLEVPGYYYRHKPDGSWSDAAACGNETASERTMMRKFMIESCLWWVKEYHIDGFRFDLMGIHDIQTMNELTAELMAAEPSLIFYGEGWTAGGSPLPDSLRALKANMTRVDRVAAFSDELRDGLKGSVFDELSTGFVNGSPGAAMSVKFGIVGAVQHPQVNYPEVNYSKNPWAREPWQCINYVSCHDNHTLADKLRISGKGNFSPSDLEKMDLLANGVVLTSQGIPFIHAGEEMMRTKKGDHNSYNKPDSINAIDWTWKSRYKRIVEHYKSLIAQRRAHPSFTMPTASQVRDHLSFLPTPSGVIAYTLDGSVSEDQWKDILVIANTNSTTATLSLPPATRWKVSYDGSTADGTSTKEYSGSVKVASKTLVVCYR